MKVVFVLVSLCLAVVVQAEFADNMENLRVIEQGEDRLKVKFDAFDKSWVLKVKKVTEDVVTWDGEEVKSGENYYYKGKVKGSEGSTVEITVPNKEDNLIGFGTIIYESNYYYCDKASVHYKSSVPGYIIWQAVGGTEVGEGNEVLPIVRDPTYDVFPSVAVFGDEEFYERYGARGPAMAWSVINDMNAVFKKANVAPMNPSESFHYLRGEQNIAPGTTRGGALLDGFRKSWMVQSWRRGAYDMAILFTGKEIDVHGAAYRGSACLLSTADYLQNPRWASFASSSVGVVRLSSSDYCPINGAADEALDGSDEDVCHLNGVKTAGMQFAHMLGASNDEKSSDASNLMNPSFSGDLSVGDLHVGCNSVQQLFKSCQFKVENGRLTWVDHYDCTSPRP